MTNLTPERRAELRGLAESAQPFIRYCGTNPAAVYVPATDLTALLDAADEADRLQDVERRLAVLLCNLTGGKLSKTDYPVELMEQEIEEYLAGHHESDLRDERDRLAAQVEQVRALHVPVRIYDECECEDTTTPGHVDVEEVGITCNLLYIACRECCTSGVDIRYQTEDCANGHDHRDTQCPTIAALDGPGESA